MVKKKNLWRFFKTVNDAKSRKPGHLTKKPPKQKFKKRPKVSIVTYVYCTKQNNRWVQLTQNIVSIKSQGYPTYEHIIVDDGSPVPLGNWLKSRRDKHILYLKKPHTGILKNTKTFNHGLKHITGKYGMILSSDDIHIPGTINKFVNYLEQNNNVVAVTGNIYHQTLKKNGELIGQRKVIRKEKIPIRRELMNHNCVNACATMFRTSALKQIQLPPNQTGFAADYDLWVRLSEIGPIKRIPDIVIKYRNFGNATRLQTQKDKNYRQKCLSYIKNTAKARRRKK